MGKHESLEALSRATAALERLDVPDGVRVIVSQGAGLAFFTDDVDQVRYLRRQVGAMTKHDGAGRLVLGGEFDGVRVEVWPPNGSCERVQVGTRVEREVPDEVFAAYAVEREVPVYGWDCGSLLNGDGEQVPA